MEGKPVSLQHPNANDRRISNAFDRGRAHKVVGNIH